MFHRIYVFSLSKRGAMHMKLQLICWACWAHSDPYPFIPLTVRYIPAKMSWEKSFLPPWKGQRGKLSSENCKRFSFSSKDGTFATILPDVGLLDRVSSLNRLSFSLSGETHRRYFLFSLRRIFSPVILCWIVSLFLILLGLGIDLSFTILC